MTSSPTSLTPTPPIGWNSWNMLGQDISEASIRETADAFVSSGLKDHGYNYIVIDDCWSVKDGGDSNGVAVSIIKRGSRGEDITVKARDIDLLDTPKLARNLWTQQDITDFKIELPQRVQPHETILLKVAQ